MRLGQIFVDAVGVVDIGSSDTSLWDHGILLTRVISISQFVFDCYRTHISDLPFECSPFSYVQI